MKPEYDPNKLEVYTESRKRRVLVGALQYLSDRKVFQFEYDEKYRSSKSAISLGPELDLFQKTHTSKKLFASLADRIPSRSNPAYEEYCRAVGVDPHETNAIRLLTTIGKKGPSTFVFEPVVAARFSSADLLRFRKDLRLSRHEFASAFGLNQLTVRAIENNKSRNTAVFRLIEIFLTFPEVGLWQLDLTGRNVNQDALDRIRSHLLSRTANQKGKRKGLEWP